MVVRGPGIDRQHHGDRRARPGGRRPDGNRPDRYLITPLSRCEVGSEQRLNRVHARCRVKRDGELGSYLPAGIDDLIVVEAEGAAFDRDARHTGVAVVRHYAGMRGGKGSTKTAHDVKPGPFGRFVEAVFRELRIEGKRGEIMTAASAIRADKTLAKRRQRRQTMLTKRRRR